MEIVCFSANVRKCNSADSVGHVNPLLFCVMFHPFLLSGQPGCGLHV